MTRSLDERASRTSAAGEEGLLAGGSRDAKDRAAGAPDRRPDLRQAKRLVQPVVDSIMKHEYSIVG